MEFKNGNIIQIINKKSSFYKSYGVIVRKSRQSLNYFKIKLYDKSCILKEYTLDFTSEEISIVKTKQEKISSLIPEYE